MKTNENKRKSMKHKSRVHFCQVYRRSGLPRFAAAKMRVQFLGGWVGGWDLERGAWNLEPGSWILGPGT